MNNLSYNEQLLWLEAQVKRKLGRSKDMTVPEDSLILFLSLAESVKTARDHNLNCSHDYPKFPRLA